MITLYYQNCLTQTTATDAETGEEAIHTYAYNAYGEVAKQDDVSFTYGDVSGQVTRETKELAGGKTITKEYAYDSGDNRTGFTVRKEDTSLLSLSYAYDGAGRLTSVTDDDGQQAVSYSYDEDGSLAEKTVSGAELTTSYSYDCNNHLTSMQNETNASGVISSYESAYLNNGQKAEEKEVIKNSRGQKSSKKAVYTYDLLGRITKESKTGSDDISYTYDSNNNRKEQKTGDKTIAYSYNKNDELLRTDTLNTKTEKDAVVIYKNDKNWNQLAAVYRKQTENTGEPYLDVDVTLGDNRLNENVVNHYNALNQLTSTLTKDSKVSFTYDAEGLRTSKTVNGEETLYIWDNDQLVLELTKSGKVKKRYIRGNDLIYADEGEGTDQTYYAMNPHGDVVQLIDGQGNVTKTYEYDSFGNELEEDSKDDNPFRYCGEYYDKETGEVYLRARYYQPEVGRFLTRDTYTGQEDDPLSLHLYAYCGYDGVNGVDPSGHVVETVADAVSLADSVHNMVKKPSLKNAALLAWDVTATVLPGAPASYVVKAPTKIVKAAKKTKKVVKVKVSKTAKKSSKAAKKSSKATKNSSKRKKNKKKSNEKSENTRDVKVTKIATPTSNPNAFVKLKGNQGYKDKKGNIWKKDKLHKDHWDISNSKGKKIKEVDFEGREIWPNGPKNKNKK